MTVKPSNPTVSDHVVGAKHAMRAEAATRPVVVVSSLRDWVTEVREVAEYKLASHIRDLADEFKQFEEFGRYPGIRHTATLEELRGTLEAFQNIEAALGYLIRDFSREEEQAS